MWGGCLKINRGICFTTRKWTCLNNRFNTNSHEFPPESHFGTIRKHLFHKNILPPSWCSFADTTREEKLNTQTYWRNWAIKKNLLIHILDLKHYSSIVLGWIWLGLSSHSQYIHTSTTTVKKDTQNILKFIWLDFKKIKKWNVLNWESQSSDRNRTKTNWAVHARKPSNISQRKNSALTFGTNFPPTDVRRLVDGWKECLTKAVSAKGVIARLEEDATTVPSIFKDNFVDIFYSINKKSDFFVVYLKITFFDFFVMKKKSKK